MITQDPNYVLDANVLMEAARRYYAFDLAPKFWDSLKALATTGRICSIDRIQRELVRGRDELATWVGQHFNHAFASTDEAAVIDQFDHVMNWVQAQSRFMAAAKAEFASSPDGWLVAYAKAKGCVVVTHEVPAPEAKAKVKIPDVCRAVTVSFVDTFEMLRRLGVRFT